MFQTTNQWAANGSPRDFRFQFWDKAMFDVSASRTKSKEIPCEDAEHLWSSRSVIRALAKTYIKQLDTNHITDQSFERPSGFRSQAVTIPWCCCFDHCSKSGPHSCPVSTSLWVAGMTSFRGIRSSLQNIGTVLLNISQFSHFCGHWRPGQKKETTANC